MDRRNYLIAMVGFWIAAVLTVFTLSLRQEFEWLEFLLLGLFLVLALWTTVAWRRLKDDKTD